MNTYPIISTRIITEEEFNDEGHPIACEKLFEYMEMKTVLPVYWRCEDIDNYISPFVRGGEVSQLVKMIIIAFSQCDGICLSDRMTIEVYEECMNIEYEEKLLTRYIDDECVFVSLHFLPRTKKIELFKSVCEKGEY